MDLHPFSISHDAADPAGFTVTANGTRIGIATDLLERRPRWESNPRFVRSGDISFSGARAISTQKHVGLNVAADPLMTLAYVGVRAGLVVLSADDPNMFSSQNEQDNRYYSKISGLPMLEPSSVQEAKDMVAYAFGLSEQLQEPVILRTTTRINHSSAVVSLGDIRAPKTKGAFPKDPFNYVTVPAVSLKLHAKLLDNLAKAAEISESSAYNQIDGQGAWGVICNGVSFNYINDAVQDLGHAGRE